MKIGDSIKVKKRTCVCGYVLDMSASVGGNFIPQKGDYSVCVNCGQLYVYDENKIQRLATLEESQIFSKLPEAKDIIIIRNEYEKRRNHKS